MRTIDDVALDLNSSLALPAVTNIARAYDSASVAESRFTMMLLLVFATVGLSLCFVGLYGVVSHLVSQQTREIGIRIALGSTRAGVARLVLRRASRSAEQTPQQLPQRRHFNGHRLPDDFGVDVEVPVD